MTITTPKEMEDATEALKSWFQSQDISPAEAVGVCSTFIGAMVGTNHPNKMDTQIKNVISIITISAMLYSLEQSK